MRKRIKGKYEKVPEIENTEKLKTRETEKNRKEVLDKEQDYRDTVKVHDRMRHRHREGRKRGQGETEQNHKWREGKPQASPPGSLPWPLGQTELKI